VVHKPDKGAPLAAVIVLVGVAAIVALGVARSPHHNQIVAAQRGDDQRVCAATGIAMGLQANPSKDPSFTDDMNTQYQIMRDAFTEKNDAHTVLINDPLYYPVTTWFSGDPSTNTVYGPTEKAAILNQCAALGFPITIHPPA
jgi:hypothetical protein